MVTVSEKGLIIERVFTKYLKKDHSVRDLFQWKKVDISIKNHKTGEILFEGTNLEFPEHFSQNACEIIAKMYFRKAGLPTPEGHEVSYWQVVSRMCNFWCKALVDEGVIQSDQYQALFDELAYGMISQMWAPNSPQWFNTGLAHAYGISGEGSGLYYYDEKNACVSPCKDAYSRTQASACFISEVQDSLLGERSIMDAMTTASRLFKFGSGIGINWSRLRGKGEPMSGGGVSSGLMSFLKVFDENAGAIKSGGVTRRASVLIGVDIDHPEIRDFIGWKATEEKKVAALGKMGYSTDIAGEAYETVSGQNVNNSVVATDEFMQKVMEDQKNKSEHNTITLKGRVSTDNNKELSTKDLWRDIVEAAWQVGDPGLLFRDTINKWNTCAASGQINTSNPCGEFLFLDNSACNLASINVLKFYNDETFDMAKFNHLVELIQLALEGTIHWGAFPTKEIAENSYLFRPTGLGLSNVGALIMAMALPYDSCTARADIEFITSNMTASSYMLSAKVAKVIGPFQKYSENKDSMRQVLQLHQTAAENIPQGTRIRTNDNIKFLNAMWAKNLQQVDQKGFRNAQVTLMAPCGTIGFAMDCASTGIEPFFAHIVWKKVVDGSYIQLVNPLVTTALKKLGYTDTSIHNILEWMMNHDGCIEGSGIKDEDLPVFDTANRCGSGTRYIRPVGHVDMVAAIQPHISGGQSKTINLPADASMGDISDIYLYAWVKGCKGITVYRDGCKVCQPLNTATTDTSQVDPLDQMKYADLLAYAKNLRGVVEKSKIIPPTDEEEGSDAPRPENKEAEDMVLAYGNAMSQVRELKRENHDLKAKVSSLEDQIEAMGDEQNETSVRPTRERLPNQPRCIKNSVKMEGNTYHIQRSFYDDGRLGEIFVSVGKQGSTIKGLVEVMCIIISKCLQYGVKPEIISKILRNTDYAPNGFVSGHENIKSVTSITDMISKFIDISMGDYRFCQVKPQPTDTTDKEDTMSSTPKVVDTSEDDESHKMIGGERVFGRVCSECGSDKIVKAGTCYYCQSCGSSTGCS